MRSHHAIASACATITLLALAGCGSPASTSGTSNAPSTAATSTAARTTTSGGAPTASVSTSPAPATGGQAAAPSSRRSDPGAIPLGANVQPHMIAGARDVPYLAFRLDAPWQQTVRDKDGVDQWLHGPWACVLTTFDDRLPSGGSDRAATDLYVRRVTDAIHASSPTTRVRTRPDLVLARTGAAPVAFEARRLEGRLSPKGMPLTTQIAARAFVGDRTALLVMLDCPRSVEAAHPDLLRDILTRGHIASSVLG